MGFVCMANHLMPKGDVVWFLTENNSNRGTLGVSRQVPTCTVPFVVIDARLWVCPVWLPCSTTTAKALALFSWQRQQFLRGCRHGQ